jgi:cation:H+ antiporter
MLIDLFFILGGLTLLFFGGEGLVRGAVNIAEHYKLSTLFVSLVIVGFGTSLPELLVCVQAALNGSPDMALGNIIGSNIANTFLIVGIGAVIAPIICTKKNILRDSKAVIVISLYLSSFVLLQTITRPLGIAMLFALSGYLFWSYAQERTATTSDKADLEEYESHIAEDVGNPEESMFLSAIYVLIGLVGLAVGAKLLVSGATNVARGFGVSEAIIGLSLVAIGTSLPEMATAVIAAMKKHGDVIIGNVLGSNLFNVMAVLGTTAVISPLPFGGRVAQIDIWVLLFSAIILYPAILTGKKISRLEGTVFLAIYTAYIGAMFIWG